MRTSRMKHSSSGTGDYSWAIYVETRDNDHVTRLLEIGASIVAFRDLPIVPLWQVREALDHP